MSKTTKHRAHAKKRYTTVDKNGETKHSYMIWKGMMNRCYREIREESICYIDCEVCSEWHDYGNFEKWYKKNYYTLEDGERVHLDKDIRVRGNKVYSPSTCAFVPQSINSLITEGSHSKRTNGLPIGVIRMGKGYQAYLSINGERKTLGMFKTIREAFECYAKAKKQNIIDMANKYKYCLTDEVYNALLNWEIPNPYIDESVVYNIDTIVELEYDTREYLDKITKKYTQNYIKIPKKHKKTTKNRQKVTKKA